MGVYVKCSAIPPKFTFHNELPEGIAVPPIEDNLEELFNQINPPAELEIQHIEIIDAGMLQREHIAQMYLQIMFVILLFLALHSIYKYIRGMFYT